MKQLLSAFLFLFITVTGFSQSLTEGKIVYEISYPDTTLDALTISMLPTEATLYFKNGCRADLFFDAFCALDLGQPEVVSGLQIQP